MSRIPESFTMRTFGLLAAGLAVLLVAGPSRAQDLDPMTQAHARRVAIAVCGSCHGRSGISEQPKFPHLAGQKPEYIAAQLKAFKSQSRGDPDALSYMWGMSAPLEDETIAALAQYYAMLPAPAPVRRSVDSGLVSKGRDIYEHGVEAIGVPACAACHGPDAHGLVDFPRLAGQTSQYVLKQLTSFQNNMRNMAVMHGVAQGLRSSEMQAVAAYLQTLP
jgi:cytochrome c553